MSVGGNVATVSFNKAVCRRFFWDAVAWEVTLNGVVAQFEDLGDNVPLCNAAADNGVTSASLILMAAPTTGSLVAVTLTSIGRIEFRDAAGNSASGPQTRTTTAGAAEAIPPTLFSAAGGVGATTVTLTFSEPVFCTFFSFDPEDIFLTDNNPATTDPTVTGAGSNSCGPTQLTADNSFSFFVNAALPGNTTFTVILTPGVR